MEPVTILKRTALAAAIVAGVLAIGLPATAQDSDSGTSLPSWVTDALEGLVDDGTLEPEQAEAVEDALDEAKPERPDKLERRGPFRFGLPGFDGDLLEGLDLDLEALREDLRDGSTLGEALENQGIDVDEVLETVRSRIEERLDEAVENGRLSEHRAESMLESITDAIGSLLENGFTGENGPRFGFGHGPRRGFGFPFHFDFDFDFSPDGPDSESDETPTRLSI